KHEKSPSALPVKAEVLRARSRHQGFRHLRNERTRACGVFVESVAEALIGEIEERHEAQAGAKVGNLLPLTGGEVGAGWVVAARVQHEHITALGRLHRGDELVEAEALRSNIEVAVVADGESGGLEDGLVVRPGGAAK